MVATKTSLRSALSNMGFGVVEDKNKSSKTRRKKGGGNTTTQSSQAGLLFPVGRVKTRMKKGRYAASMGVCAPVFLTAVLQNLTADLLEEPGKKAKENDRRRINPRLIHLNLDDEFKQLLHNVTMRGAGVQPDNIHSSLLPKKGKKKPGEGGDEDETQFGAQHGAKKRGTGKNGLNKKVRNLKKRTTPKKKSAKKAAKKAAKRGNF